MILDSEVLMRPLARVHRPGLQLVSAGLVVLVAAGCESSVTDPEIVDPGASLTVDASSTESWALVDLGSPAQVVQAPDPATSAAWDLGFQTTKVMLNGGASGPAGMVAYCLCQNAGATNEQIMAMTPDSERAEFEGVTRAQIPAAGEAWSATVFDGSKWYRYNLDGNHQIWPTYDVYLVKRGSEVYKVQITGYYGADGKARQITFRYARLAD
jgi:hypothetical protein